MRDFARHQRDPKRHLVGLSVVVLLHIVVIYGLMTGLARKAVEVIKKPVSATIVEEIKKPPPPPPPPPKKIEPPKTPPPIKETYVPPPDIPPPPQIVEQPTITAIAPEPPKEPYVIAPPPPPTPAPTPPKPAIRRGVTKIAGEDPTYPREAIKAGVSKGRVVARLRIDEQGNVTDVDIIASNPPRVFDRVVNEALRGWKFRAEGEKYVGEVEINFTLKDE
jgi:periplasmic protein TonB